MSIARLDVSLERYEIGLSGAIPARGEWSEPAMDRGILEFVALLSGLVFKYGGRIIHGCHPTFTPIILRQARLQAAGRKRRPVTLIMSELWAQDLAEAAIGSMAEIAEFLVTRKVGDKGPEDPNTRNGSLTAMRNVLISAQNVTVAVGGMMHKGDGIVPGLVEELGLSESNGLPRFLVGGLGGMARALAQSIDPARLGNRLPDQANIDLFCTDDVTACVNIIFEQLAGSDSLAGVGCKRPRWNADRRAIVDSRSGEVDERTSAYLLRCY